MKKKLPTLERLDVRISNEARMGIKKHANAAPRKTFSKAVREIIDHGLQRIKDLRG